MGGGPVGSTGRDGNAAYATCELQGTWWEGENCPFPSTPPAGSTSGAIRHRPREQEGGPLGFTRRGTRVCGWEEVGSKGGVPLSKDPDGKGTDPGSWKGTGDGGKGTRTKETEGSDRP
eukprot:scaffold967_cov321-Pavlova_lutheri.AAC.5